MELNLPIFLDMDEVICDFLNKLCLEYNVKFNKNIKVNDFKTWSLSSFMGEEGYKIIKKPGFFSSLEPIEDSIQTIKTLLNEKYEIFIISSPMNEHSVFEKYLWVKKYLPFFPIKNLILVGNKGDLLEKIDNGILFDDCPEYINKFKGITVIMDRAYNREVNVDYRVNYWEDFYKIVKVEDRFCR